MGFGLERGVERAKLLPLVTTSLHYIPHVQNFHLFAGEQDCMFIE